MFRAVKIKISDQQLIEELEFLHSIFKTEYDFVRREVSLTSFDEKEYSHANRGRVTEKLAALTNKRYLAWDVNQKAKYFRMFAQQLRQDFCSLKYRYDISVILAKYGFNPSNPVVRDELKALNLYPTAQEIKNICRQGTIVRLPETLSFPLDFSLGQDKQTITQPDKKEAVFFIKFCGKWTRLSFDVPEYFKRKTQQKNFECYCKPKFVKDENQDWYVVLAIMLSTDKPSAKNDIYAGIDIGLNDRDVLAAINIALRDFKTVKHLVLTRRQFGVIACRMAESETHTKRENKSNKSYNPFNHGDLLQTC